MKYDVIIVGAGPAGSSAAYYLAAAGRKVLVLEKETFPRYKACAGGISIKALPLLDFDWQGVVEAKPRTLVFF
ncbi:MAG: FAD-dependent oxidoreductase [Bacillota bacterium]